MIVAERLQAPFQFILGDVEGCSGENLAKTESMVESMADGEGKFVAQKEVAQAQDAMLNDKMGACAAHLSKAMLTGAMR